MNRTVFFFCLLAIWVNAGAQAGDTIRNAQLGIEFARMNAAYGQADHMAFTISYRYSVSDNPAVTDSSTATYRLHKGMMSGEMAGTRLLRNNRYTVSVDTEDSLIVIGANQGGAGTFQVNVFDSLFRSANIEGFEKDAVAGGSRLRIIFKPGSYYKEYEVTYDSAYLITGVTVSYLDTDPRDNGLPPPAGSRKIIQMGYGGYHAEGYDISIFDEGQYVRKDEYGKWSGAGAYAGWQVMASHPGL